MALFPTIKPMLWYPKGKGFDYLIRIHILFGKFQNIYFSIHCKQIIDEQKIHTLIKRQNQSFSYWKLTIRRWELYFCPNNTPFKYRYGNQDKWCWSHIWMVFACFWVHSIFFIYLYDWFLFVTCCSMSQGYFSILLPPSKIWRQNFRNKQLFWRPTLVILDRLLWEK